MRMKIFLTSLILILFGQMTFGQKTKRIKKDELLFEKALLLHHLIHEDLSLEEVLNSKDSTKGEIKEFAIDIKESILEKALEFYQELIDDFPESDLLFRALNNKGFIELALEDTEEATKTFQKILDSEADDMEKGGLGSGIMAEPYANYKNRAAKILAKIYIEEKDYKKAIDYLDLTKQFPYRHFCGNEYAADEIYMVELYAKCYFGLSDTSKALKMLLPNLLENGLADNSDIVNLTIEILQKRYTKAELRTLYENAFKSYKTEKAQSNGANQDESYYITFLDTKIEITSWQLRTNKPEEKQKAIENICQTSQFYKLLTE